MNARRALAEAERRLAAVGVETPRVDAEWLVAHALGTTRTGVYADLDREVEDGWEPLLARREAREPLAYVLGEWGFRRLTLRTDARALVPRPETEVLVERALVLLADTPAPRILDLGVGSGAIALALKDERPDARVTGVDISGAALALARENAERLGLDVELREGGIEDAEEGWDLVVSNPPYVDSLDGLAPELRYEPEPALIGTGFHEQIARTARTQALALEVGDGPGATRSRTRSRSAGYPARYDHDRPRGNRARRRRARDERRHRGDPRGRAGDTADRHGLRPRARRRSHRGGGRALYALKGREALQPSALLGPDLDMLFECVPELRGRAGRDRARAAPRAVHARAAEPRAPLRLDQRDEPAGDRRARAGAARSGPPHPRRVGSVVATSANLPGGPDPAGSIRSPRRSSTASPPSSTRASCPGVRRPYSTSRATSPASCARVQRRLLPRSTWSRRHSPEAPAGGRRRIGPLADARCNRDRRTADVARRVEGADVEHEAAVALRLPRECVRRCVFHAGRSSVDEEGDLAHPHGVGRVRRDRAGRSPDDHLRRRAVGARGGCAVPRGDAASRIAGSDDFGVPSA